MDARRAVRVLVLTGLCAGALPGSVSAQSDAQAQDPYYYFLLGRHLANQGNVSGALAALQRAAAGDPKSAEIRAEIARLHLEDENLNAAEAAAQEALKIDAENFEANRVLGLVFTERTERSPRRSARRESMAREAVRYLERAAAQAPNDANINYRLGRMAQEAGDLDKAIAALTRVVNQNPFSVDARVLLAQAHATANDLPAAIRTLGELADSEPSVLGLLSNYQLMAGEYAASAASAEKALVRQPDSAPLKQLRIQALLALKRYREAAEAASAAQRQHADDPTFGLLHADALKNAGDTARAEEVLRQVAKVHPDNPRVLNHLGYLLAEEGRDLDEAIRLVNRALELEPNQPAYLDSLGWAYFQRGDLALAEKYLGAAAEMLPSNAEILDHLGDLHARRGRWQDAILVWTRALERANNDIDPETVKKKIQDAQNRLANNKR